MFKDSRNFLGIALILAGVLLALQQFGIITGGAEAAVFTVLFGLGAALMAGIFITNRQHWWAALVAFILTGLALTSGLELLAPRLSDQLGGSVFLGMLGLGFVAVYFIDRRMWWAIIPGGVLLSLALLTYLEELPGRLPFEPAGVLFIGMGITFFLLSRVRDSGQRLSWGIYPAIPLLIFGFMLAFGTEALWGYIGPLMLIAGGGYLLYRSLRKK